MKIPAATASSSSALVAVTELLAQAGHEGDRQAPRRLRWAALGRPATRAPNPDLPQPVQARPFLHMEHSRSICDRVYVPTRVLAALPEVTFTLPGFFSGRLFFASRGQSGLVEHLERVGPRRWDRHLDPDGGLRSLILPRRPPGRHRWFA